jgi:hypothetical protein
MTPAKIWACTSLGTCASSFVVHAIPFLQFVALALSIAAAIRAWRVKK